MSRKLIMTIIILSLCFIVLQSAFPSNTSKPVAQPHAVNGLLDLSDWNFKQNGLVALDGEWEFYWQEFLTPKDFARTDFSEKNEHIILPRAWNKYILNDHILSGDGYATYRLTVKHTSTDILSIKIPRIFTAYTLWANEELIASSGKVGIDYTSMIPQYLPQVEYISPESDTIEFVIQVSNFRHRSGGILESIQIGSTSQISEVRTKNLTLELFLFGGLFIIGFYHISLFLFRTKDRSTLYFGIYSLLISARTILVGEIYFIQLFPDFSWEIAHKLQTLAYYLGVPLVFQFLKETFPQDTSKKIITIIKTIAIGFGLLVLFTPVKIFSQFNPLYQVFSILTFSYALYIVIISCIKKREGSYLIGLGVTILILFTVNDMIFLSVLLADSSNHFMRSYVTRGNLSSWGLLIFIFTQSLVLAKKSSKSFTNVELLSEQLQQINSTLEEQVHDRTLALEKSKEELSEAYLTLSKSKSSLQGLMQNLSHDLRSPLTTIKGYTNAILDGVVTQPDKQQKYLTRINDKVDHLNHMVHELFDLSQLQSRQLALQYELFPLKQIIRNLADKCYYDTLNEKVIFNIEYPPCWQDETSDLDSLYVRIDYQRIERVLTNLFNNAIKYTPEEGHLDLKFYIDFDYKNLIIVVSDTGIGIAKEDLPHIFERFYTLPKAHGTNTKGTGLGLAIVKEILEYHNGKIWVLSEQDKGSQFFVSLPICNINSIDHKEEQ